MSDFQQRQLTPQQWEALKHEVERRARDERARALRNLVRRLLSWSHGRSQRAESDAQNYSSSNARPIYFGGRI